MIGQLTSESRTGYSGSYTYDANGNRLTRTVGGVTQNYAYDDADKLQDVKIGGVTQKSYGYDTAGRTTSVVSSAGTTTLAYDYEGRISTITYPSTATNTFTYNGLDTRVSKVDSAGTSTYKRDGAGVTAPVLSDASAVYTPGISERRSSTTTYLHSGLKNADSQSGTGQTIAATKQYDAFGNVLSSTGTWKGPFGYAGSFGYQEDVDSSLKLLGHRYYDPSTGRFLTRDPIKDGRNWYAYCENNPISIQDCDGKSAYYLGVGGSILSPFAGSVMLQGWWDPQTGRIGFGATGGYGGGAGVGVGADLVSVGYDPTIDLHDGPPQYPKGMALGAMTPLLSAEIALDENGYSTGGWGISIGPAAGGGVYAERRQSVIVTYADGPRNPPDGPWDNWPSDLPKPNDRVQGTLPLSPKYH